MKKDEPRKQGIRKGTHDVNQAEYLSLEEIKERGTPLFPIGFYLGKYMGRGSILHYHWHKQWQWIYMVRGDGIISVDDQKYHVAAGESVFIRGGQMHSGITENPEGAIHLSIVFDPEGIYGAPRIVRQYYEDFKSGRHVMNVKFGNTEEGEKRVNACLKAILQNASNAQAGFELIILSKMQAILGYVMKYELCEARTAHTPIHRSGQDDRIALALDHIHKHFSERLTLQGIAEAAGISVQKLCKDFKTLTGTTVVEYLNTYRIYEACILLREGSHTARKVAEMCGFETPSYFIKLFKRVKGVTPMAYKQGFINDALPDFTVTTSVAVHE